MAVPNVLARLTQQQKVTRLYRHSLRHLLSWIVDRQAWRKEAVMLRAKFDANKDETDRRKIAKLLDDAYAEFEFKKHPYPYIFPTSPDGSKWERNIPPAPHVLHMLPQEEQWYKEMIDWADYKTD